MTSNEMQMPSTWEICSLEDIVDRMSNGSSAKQYDAEIGYPISRIETIWNGYIDLSRVKYVEEIDPEFIEKYKLLKGDILFSHINSDTHLGKTAIFRNQTKILIHGINLLLLRPNININPEFLNYQIEFLRFQGEFIQVAQKAVNQSSINQAKLKKFKILIPPILEQHRIVAKVEDLFSELDTGVEALKTVQQQLKVYRQSVLKWAFEGKLTEEWRKQQKDLPTVEALLEQIAKERIASEQAGTKKAKKNKKDANKYTVPGFDVPEDWCWLRVNDLSQSVFDGPFGSNLKTNDYKADGIRVVRLENIGELKFRDELKTYISEEKYEGLKKHKVTCGDIVFSSFISDKVRVTVLPKTIEVAINKADCFCIRTSTELALNHYIAFFLSTRFTYHLLSDNVHGATRPRINTTQLKDCPIPYCSLPEQATIVHEIEFRLSVADKLEETVEQSLKQAEALRQSILKKAFEGRLLSELELAEVRSDPEWEPASVLLDRIKAQKANSEPKRMVKEVSSKYE